MFLLFGILSNPDCKSYDLEFGIANPVQRVAGKAGVKFLGFQIIR
jgi:hypothetical protein